MEAQTQPEQNLTPPSPAEGELRRASKKERRQMRREEKRLEAENVKKARGRKNIVVWAAVIVLIVAGGFGIYKFLFSGTGGPVVFDITNTCINHTGASMHIHPELRIVINGEKQDVPANVGVSPACMRPLHTHDDTGRLHVEFPQPRNFTLGEFFKVWDKPFLAAQIFDYIADDTRTLTMTVNGVSNNEFENLVLKDRDQIEIRYGQISE